jgi:hypothetical protein
MVHPPTQDSE